MEAEVPASRLLPWDLRMPTNLRCMTRSPRPLLSPAQYSFFWGLLNEVSSPLVFLQLPAACLDPLRPGDEQAGPSGPSWRWTMLSGARTGLCWLRCAAELCQGREFAGGLSCEGWKPLSSVMVTTTFWVQEDYLGMLWCHPVPGRDPPGADCTLAIWGTWAQEPLQGRHAFCLKIACGQGPGAAHRPWPQSPFGYFLQREASLLFLGIVFGNLQKRTLSHKPFSKITFIDIAKKAEK